MSHVPYCAVTSGTRPTRESDPVTFLCMNGVGSLLRYSVPSFPSPQVRYLWVPPGGFPDSRIVVPKSTPTTFPVYVCPTPRPLPGKNHCRRRTHFRTSPFLLYRYPPLHKSPEQINLFTPSTFHTNFPFNSVYPLPKLPILLFKPKKTKTLVPIQWSPETPDTSLNYYISYNPANVSSGIRTRSTPFLPYNVFRRTDSVVKRTSYLPSMSPLLLPLPLRFVFLVVLVSVPPSFMYEVRTFFCTKTLDVIIENRLSVHDRRHTEESEILGCALKLRSYVQRTPKLEGILWIRESLSKNDRNE